MSTVKAVQDYLAHPEKYILTCDEKGLHTADRKGLKGIWTWIACKLGFKNYSLQKVINFALSDQGIQELEQLHADLKDALYEKLRANVNKFDGRHDKKIKDAIMPLFGMKFEPIVKQPLVDKENEDHVNTEEIFQKRKMPKNLEGLDYEQRALQRFLNSKNNLIAFCTGGITAVFSNFYETPIDLSHTAMFKENAAMLRCYSSAETAFQHIKWIFTANDNSEFYQAILNDPLFEALGQAKTSQEAYDLSRQLNAVFPKVYAKNWLSRRRNEVMWTILQSKFASDKILRQILDATGDAFLVSHNKTNDEDAYWSNGKDGKRGDFDLNGKYISHKTGPQKGFAPNVLGAMLMAIRRGETELPTRLLTPEHMQATQDTLEAAEKFARDSQNDPEGSIFT